MNVRRSTRRRKTAAQTTRSHLGLPAATLAMAEGAGSDLDRALALIATTRRTLLQTEVALEAILRDDIDPGEQSQASLGLVVALRERELLDNRRRTLVDGTATLRPPSDADIAEAQRVAAALAKTIAENGKVAAIVGLMADAVRLSEKLVA